MKTNNKSREALRQLVLNDLVLFRPVDCPESYTPDNMACVKMCNARSRKLCRICYDAISAYEETPRNCDVGMPNEQEGRFAEYCRASMESSADKCRGCPSVGHYCKLEWAQMPYIKGVGNE